MKIVPKDCTQCEFTNRCSSYYGGSLCRYAEEINKRALDKFWARFNKTKKDK